MEPTHSGENVLSPGGATTQSAPVIPPPPSINPQCTHHKPLCWSEMPVAPWPAVDITRLFSDCRLAVPSPSRPPSYLPAIGKMSEAAISGASHLPHFATSRSSDVCASPSPSASVKTAPGDSMLFDGSGLLGRAAFSFDVPFKFNPRSSMTESTAASSNTYKTSSICHSTAASSNTYGASSICRAVTSPSSTFFSAAGSFDGPVLASERHPRFTDSNRPCDVHKISSLPPPAPLPPTHSRPVESTTDFNGPAAQPPHPSADSHNSGRVPPFPTLASTGVHGSAAPPPRPCPMTDSDEPLSGEPPLPSLPPPPPQRPSDPLVSPRARSHQSSPPPPPPPRLASPPAPPPLCRPSNATTWTQLDHFLTQQFQKASKQPHTDADLALFIRTVFTLAQRPGEPQALSASGVTSNGPQFWLPYVSPNWSAWSSVLECEEADISGLSVALKLLLIDPRVVATCLVMLPPSKFAVSKWFLVNILRAASNPVSALASLGLPTSPDLIFKLLHTTLDTIFPLFERSERLPAEFLSLYLSSAMCATIYISDASNHAIWRRLICGFIQKLLNKGEIADRSLLLEIEKFTLDGKPNESTALLYRAMRRSTVIDQQTAVDAEPQNFVC